MFTEFVTQEEEVRLDWQDDLVEFGFDVEDDSSADTQRRVSLQVTRVKQTLDAGGKVLDTATQRSDAVPSMASVSRTTASTT